MAAAVVAAATVVAVVVAVVGVYIHSRWSGGGSDRSSAAGGPWCTSDDRVPVDRSVPPLEPGAFPPAGAVRETPLGDMVAVLDPYSGAMYTWDSERHRMLGPAPRQRSRFVSLRSGDMRDCQDAVMPGYPTPVNQEGSLDSGVGVMIGSNLVVVPRSGAPAGVTFVPATQNGLGRPRLVAPDPGAPLAKVSAGPALCSNSPGGHGGCAGASVTVQMSRGSVRLASIVPLPGSRVGLFYAPQAKDASSRIVVLDDQGTLLQSVDLGPDIWDLLSDGRTVVAVRSAPAGGRELTVLDSIWMPTRTVTVSSGFFPDLVVDNHVIGTVEGMRNAMTTERVEGVDLASGTTSRLTDDVTSGTVAGYAEGAFTADTTAVWWAPLGSGALWRIPIDGTAPEVHPICDDVLGIGRGTTSVYVGCIDGAKLTVDSVAAPAGSPVVAAAETVIALPGA